MNHLMRIPLAALVLLFSMSLIFAQTSKSDETDRPAKVTTDKSSIDATDADKKSDKMSEKAASKEVKDKDTKTTEVKKTRKEMTAKTTKKDSESPGFFKRLFGKKGD